jgi:hypothetical protein
MWTRGVFRRRVRECKALALSLALAGAFSLMPNDAAADDATETATKTATPPRPDRVLVQFLAENPERKHVVVSLDTGERCQTPCTLRLYPGSARIAVRGDREFETEIDVPPQGDQFVVRPGSIRNSVLSLLLVVAGAGTAVAGLAINSASDCPGGPDADMWCVERGSIAIIGGLAVAAGGIVLLLLSAKSDVYPTSAHRAASVLRWPQVAILPKTQGASFVGEWRF